MGATEFINSEVKKLLKDGIIKPSRSPFNSPTWVVDKKDIDAYGNTKKRLVIDFRKLNKKTIPDRDTRLSIPMIIRVLPSALWP